MSFPTLNSREEASKISAALVDELRQKFLALAAKTPELYYDSDIEKIKSNDWQIRRFLNLKKSNVDKALEYLDAAMKWRKSFGVLDITAKDFPKEFFLTGCAFLYGTDLNGAQLVIVRGKVNRKIKAWVPVGQKFMVWLVEQAENNDTGKGLTLLLDSKESGVKNSDLDMMKFAHKVLQDYYPGLVNAGLVYKLPKVMEAVYKVVRSWLDEEQSKYAYLCSKKNINEYVAVDQLPDFLLGTNTAPYRVVPEGVPTAHELAEKLGIKVEKADKLVKHCELFYEQ